MKRIIIAICCAVLLVAACVEPMQPYVGPVHNEPEDGAPGTLTFSLPPSSTCPTIPNKKSTFSGELPMLFPFYYRSD